MLQDSLRRFLRDRHSPQMQNAAQYPPGYDAGLWSGLAELGVFAALFSEKDGGFGGLGADIAVVFEELGRAGVTAPVTETCILGGGLLSRLGDSNQKELITGIMEGSCQIALAHAEPDGRYDLSFVSARAVPQSDGIVLNGQKSVVVNAQAADFLIISAREDGAADASEGISLFLVPSGADGIVMRDFALVGGGRAAEISIENLLVSEAARLGPAGAAFPVLEEVTAAAITATCAATLGAMISAADLTRDYLATRKQFGRPIGSFQALAHRMADMMIALEQARSAVILAAGHLEASRDVRELHASAAKNLIGRTGRLIAEESIQMHGGIGMTAEYGLGHLARQIVMADHRFGDTDHHLERFIALTAA